MIVMGLSLAALALAACQGEIGAPMNRANTTGGSATTGDRATISALMTKPTERDPSEGWEVRTWPTERASGANR